MPIRDKLINEQLKPKNNDHVQHLTAEDIHEKPQPYKRWVPGLRTLVRLRYLGLKKAQLTANKQALKYDVSADEINHSVQTRLQGQSTRRSLWAILLRPYVALPITALLTLGAGFGMWQFYQSELDRAVFKQDIPLYSNTVYELKAANSDAPDDEQTTSPKVESLQNELAHLEEKILTHFEKQPSVTPHLQALLTAIQSDELNSVELFALVKKLNDELFVQRIPYYINSMVEPADCSHLPLSSFLPRLFGGDQGSGETCIVYALLSFHVEEFRYYEAEKQNHRAMFTRRIDGLQLNENVLGKVHIGDNTAQILLSNIDASSAGSLQAVDEGKLQSKLMPQGMSDVYGLEAIARRLQTRVLDGYTEELEASPAWRVKKAFKQLFKQDSPLLPEATRKLQRRTADVTAFHEVQHLVDQFNDLQAPDWFAHTLREVAGNIAASPQFKKHVLWELSAFFTHLNNGEELKGILLNEFTAITLNPLLQDQPHYYSIRILLPILHAMQQGTLTVPPPPPALSLSEVAKHYKALAADVENLDQLARDSYRILFDRELPGIDQTAIQSVLNTTAQAQ